MRYKARVVNAPEGVKLRTDPSISANISSSLPNNATFVAIDSKSSMEGSIWLQDETTRLWVPFRMYGKTYAKMITNLENQGAQSEQGESSNPMPKEGHMSTTNQDVLFRLSKQVVNTNVRMGITDPHAIVAKGTKNITMGDNLNPPKQEVLPPAGANKISLPNELNKPYTNSNNYPLATKNQRRYIYDYTMDLSDIAEAMNDIKRDMNIPFGDIYTIPKINRLMHTQFNRFRVVYPDYERQRLIPYVFFTRPDLNLFNSSGKATEGLKANPQLDYLVASNPMTAKALTLEYTSSHVLNPLLCNRVASFDVADDTIEVQETGETFTGYKMKMAKNSIKSMVGGSINIKFPETYNLAITTMHQIWVGYENAVYRGFMEPRREYITGKIIDYACDIFYFLADSQGIIRFWSQIYGAIPTNVNKSVFSYDEGSLVSFPSVSITYEYFLRKDWEPDTIIDFNIAAGMSESVATKMYGQSSQPRLNYLVDYVPALGHSGRTWAGPPFIEPFLEDDGSGKQVQRFRIRFRPSTEDV